MRFIFLALLLFINSLSFAQVSLKNPKICNDGAGKFMHYYDGYFSIDYRNGRLDSWASRDSIISFDEHARQIQIQGTAKQITINADAEGIRIACGTEVLYVKDSVKRMLNMAALSLQVSSTNWRCHIETEVAGYAVVLEFYRFSKDWKWSQINITKDWVSFATGYNSYFYAGPQFLTIQDEGIKFGVSISNSFKTNKYIWAIRSVYYEDHKITVLPDFDYEYSRKGKFRRKKSSGSLPVCN